MLRPVAAAKLAGGAERLAALETPTLIAPVPAPPISPAGTIHSRYAGSAGRPSPSQRPETPSAALPARTSARADGRRVLRLSPMLTTADATAPGVTARPASSVL